MSRLFALLFFVASSSISLLSSSAFAATCRDIESVQASAVLANNTRMGGHVEQHVLGAHPGPANSQKDKTLFENMGKYATAWGWYAKQIRNPVPCSSKQAQQQFLLNGPMAALSCTEAAPDGACTKYLHYYAKEIFVGFIQQGNKWILNTAFPVPVKP